MSSLDSPLGIHEVVLGETRFILWCWYQHENFGYGVSPMVWRGDSAQRLKEGDSFLMWLGEPPERLLELACRYLASYCGPQMSELKPLPAYPKSIAQVIDIRELEREELTRSRRARRTRGTKAVATATSRAAAQQRKSRKRTRASDPDAPTDGIE